MVSFSSRLTRVPLPQILIYHPAFIKYVFDSWLKGHGRYPSTGILSVIFSLHICDEVWHPPLCPRGLPGDQGFSLHVPKRGGESICGQAGLHPDPRPQRSPPPWKLRFLISTVGLSYTVL